MRYLKNENGFTLIEMLIVVVIIGVAIGMTNFGLNIVFDSKVDSYAEQFHSDLRKVRNDTLSAVSTSEKYALVWSSSGDSYDIKGISTNNVISTVELASNVIVKKDGVVISSYGDVGDRTIAFNDADGSITTSGAGIYVFSSSNSDDVVTVSAIQSTGRVFLDE